MSADFRFYLNRQGLRGQKGEKGDTGFSPSIVEEVNTLTDYRLKIINEFDEFVTDNLRGSDYFDVTDPNGTYLKYDNVSHRAYTGSLDQATGEAIGGAMLAQPEDIDTFNETKIVTPALFADSLTKLIVSPDGSIDINQNEETSKTEIKLNSTALDSIRTELNGVKQDLITESQVRLNADNQQQVAIDAERREREAQDAALQNQISSLGDNFVNIAGNQTVTGIKTFSNRVNLGDSSYIRGLADGSTLFTPSNNNGVLQIGSRFVEGMETRLEGSKVTFNYVVPQVHKDNGDFKVLTQDTIEQGDNITIEQTTNGIKISSTAGGAIIDDTTPATNKVFSSSKTSDLVGELGNEVNSIAGRLNTLEGEVKVATTENLGLVQPDGTTITIDSDGKISAVGGGSGVAIDNDTIKQNTQGQIYVNKPNKDAQSYTMRTSSDGTEAIVQNVKMPVNQEFTPSGEILYGQFVFEGQNGEQVDPLVSFNTIKAGNGMEITKDVSKGEITLSSTGGNSYTKEETNELLDKKQDILTPSDGIKIETQSVGAYPYSDNYQVLADNKQRLSLGSDLNLSIIKENPDPNEDLFFKFKAKAISLASGSDYKGVEFRIGQSTGVKFMSNPSGLAIEIRVESQYLISNTSSVRNKLTPHVGNDIEVIFKLEKLTHNISAIITDLTTGEVLYNLTGLATKSFTPLSSGTPYITSINRLSADTNFEIYAQDIVISKSERTSKYTQISAKVDNNTIEFNENGELQTTVDINALQARVEDLQLYKFPNATIEGDPTINNGQITNFSTTNYLRFPFEFKTEGRTWLLNGSFDTDTDVTTQQNIIDSLASVALAVRNGRLVLALSTNGTSFDLGEHLSMSDILANTKYYYRLSFSGTQYLLSISTDKQEWLPEIIVASDQPIASKPMTISSPGHPYKGTINLNDWDLTVANALVWQGMDDVGIASRMDVNASNITETGIEKLKEVLGLGVIEALVDAINVNYDSNSLISAQALVATPMMLALEPLELDSEDSFNTTIERATFDGDLDVTPTQFESVDYDDTDVDLGGNA